MSRLDQVGKLVEHLKQKEERPILVVSAFEKVTNALLKAIDAEHLDGKNYSESDIAVAFQPAKKLIYDVIENHFKADDGGNKHQAMVAVEARFQGVAGLLMAHKATGAGLFPGDNTWQIRDKVIALGEETAVDVLDFYLKENGYDSLGVQGVQALPFEGPADQPVSKPELHRHIVEGQKAKLGQLAAEDSGLDDKILIFGGHVGGTKRGIKEDVGRSYSDTTAIDLEEAYNQCQAISGVIKGKIDKVIFWKNVDGYYTTDPKDLDNGADAVHVGDVSYIEASEIAGAGSQLLQIQAIILAKLADVCMIVANILNPDGKTTTVSSIKTVTDRPFKVLVTQVVDIVSFECLDMVAQSGFAAVIFDAFKRKHINIVDTMDRGAKVAFACPLPKDLAELQRMRDAIREICVENRTIVIDGECFEHVNADWEKGTHAILSVIGNELVNNSAKIFSEILAVLAAYHIKAEGKSTGIKITLYVPETQRQEAVQHLHDYFIAKDKATREHVALSKAKNAQRF